MLWAVFKFRLLRTRVRRCVPVPMLWVVATAVIVALLEIAGSKWLFSAGISAACFAGDYRRLLEALKYAIFHLFPCQLEEATCIETPGIVLKD